MAPFAPNDARHPDRHLYHRALNSDEYPEWIPLLRRRVEERFAELGAAEAERHVGDGFAELEREVQALRASRQAQVAELRELAAATSVETCRGLVLDYAPTGLIDGCILQYAVGIALNHTEFGSLALRVYSHSIGDGYPARHHGAHYRDLLRSLEISVPEVATRSFIEETRVAGAAIPIGDSSFEPALFDLGLSHFPRSLLPEIVGGALFHYVTGLPPLLVAHAERLVRLGANVRYLDERRAGPELGRAAALMLDAARALLQGSAELDGVPVVSCAQRVRSGLRATAALDRRRHERTLRFVRSGGPSPRSRMKRLVRERAPQIVGYHHRSVRLEALLKDATEQPGRVLDWLVKSRFVAPGRPDESRLLTELCAFGGPMFSAFSTEELAAIRAWVEHLPLKRDDGEPPEDGAVTSSFPEGPHADAPPEATAPQEPDREPASSQEAYHRLVGFEPSLADRRFAQRVVEAWLNAGAVLSRGEPDEVGAMGLGELSLPTEEYRLPTYSAAALDRIVERQHDLQVRMYLEHHASRAAPESRESLLALFQTIAIVVLADGAWLQRAILTATSHSAIHARLFRIYSDELGNGHLPMNHCVIARQLLEEAGVHLPDIRDRSFGIQSPPPVEGMFAQAIYALAISLFPKRYFPELLGLNLAIELFGVGGQFRIMSADLEARQLNPLFYDLHNTIDNIGTGHAAWAKEAIRLFIDDAFVRGGADMGHSMWERVWMGFCSWSTASYMSRPSREAALFRGPGEPEGSTARREDTLS